jgi:hypothetical protein
MTRVHPLSRLNSDSPAEQRAKRQALIAAFAANYLRINTTAKQLKLTRNALKRWFREDPSMLIEAQSIVAGMPWPPPPVPRPLRKLRPGNRRKKPVLSPLLVESLATPVVQVA